MSTTPRLPSGVREVREVPAPGFPVLVHPEWASEHPWLVQGSTTRGTGPEPFDLGLFGEGLPEPEVRANWRALLRATGSRLAIHARQPHGAVVRIHDAAALPSDSAPVPLLVEPCDGHASAAPGVLLAVTTADCVPVSLIDERRRVVAMLHAGWRGAAQGVLEAGLSSLDEAFGSAPKEVRVHLGPSICRACYEVGPEVFTALGAPRPPAPSPIDLRAVLAHRAMGAGVPAQRITVSEHCTRCSQSGLFSHRGGDAHRQVGFLGVGLEDRTGPGRTGPVLDGGSPRGGPA